jgi:hypothetical protein
MSWEGCVQLWDTTNNEVVSKLERSFSSPPMQTVVVRAGPACLCSSNVSLPSAWEVFLQEVGLQDMAPIMFFTLVCCLGSLRLS